MSSTEESSTTETENTSLENAHGTVMVLAWMVFASTAVIFSRYGRSLRFGDSDEFLGEKIWFQFHRFLACLTTVATLLGFFLILSAASGGWVRTDEGLKFAHSVIGGIIVCCALVQAWMALFRCHVDSPFRFIFRWLHRLTGALAFFLSVPAIFIIISVRDSNRTGMIVILSLWSAWVVLIVFVLEIMRLCIGDVAGKKQDAAIRVRPSDLRLPARAYTKSDYVAYRNPVESRRHWSTPLLILISSHVIVSVALVIPLIVLIWK